MQHCRAALLLFVEAVAYRGSVRAGLWDSGMPQNFVEGRREQGFCCRRMSGSGYGAFVLDADGHNVEVVNHNRR
jgi:hypothetical protein